MTFPAALAGVLAAAAVTAVVGYAVARFFTDGLSRPEKCAWSLATGLLVNATLFLAIVSVSPGRARFPLLALDLAIVAASFLARRPTRTPRSPGEDRRTGRPVVLALLAVAALAWLAFLVSAISEPMWATDYLAMWGLKGKTIFEAGSVSQRLFRDPALSWGRPDHPLFVPISLATLASYTGRWDDQALAILFPLCSLATIAGAGGFLTRRVSPIAGSAAAALVALCFPLYRAVHAGLSEIPLALALVLVSCAYLDALASPSRRAVARLLAASLLCVWAKPEGTLFVLLLAGALGLRRRFRVAEAWKSGAWALVAPALLHAGLMVFVARPLAPRDFDATFLEPRRWGELLSRLGVVVARIVDPKFLLVGVSVVAIGLFLLMTRRGLADPLLAVFALQLLAYLVALAVSPFDPGWKVDSSFERILATLFPAFALVLGGRLPGAART